MGFDFGGFLEDVAPIALTVGGYAVGGPMGAMIGAGIGSSISGAKANRENRELAGEQMGFQERMSNTAHQRQVADLKAAGLNPLLSGTGGASTPQGASATMQNIGEGISNSAQSLLSAHQQQQQINLQTTKQEAEIGNITKDNQLKEAQRQKTLVDAEVARKGLPESDLKNKIYDKIKDQFQSTAKEFKGILDSKEPENFGVKLSPEALERMRKQSIQEMNDKQLKLPTDIRSKW